jgi:anthranilate synthase/aminodeoxychorismate synthase-like glutamine amidotransferase
MKVTVVDNRDSFTFNLVQAFGELGAEVVVVDGYVVDAGQVLATDPDLICLGPGPRGPADLDALVALTAALKGRAPTLGVCLGLQAMVRADGGHCDRARAPVHGERRSITHGGEGLFAALPSPLTVMRYHSLVAAEVPDTFEVIARDDDGQVMAIADAAQQRWGVQFHPESVGTEGGLVLLANALRLCGFAPNVQHRPGSIPAPGRPAW